MSDGKNKRDNFIDNKYWAWVNAHAGHSPRANTNFGGHSTKLAVQTLFVLLIDLNSGFKAHNKQGRRKQRYAYLIG